MYVHSTVGCLLCRDAFLDVEPDTFALKVNRDVFPFNTLFNTRETVSCSYIITEPKLICFNQLTAGYDRGVS